MTRFRLLRLLLLPSTLSFFASLLITVALLLLINRSYVTHSELLYGYFFGKQGAVTALQSSSSTGSALSHILFGSSYTYYVLVLIIAVVVGALVYLTLGIFDRVKGNLSTAWWGLHDDNQAFAKAMRTEVRTQAGVRITSFIIWIIFWTFSLKVVLPFCMLSFRTGVSQQIGWNASGEVALAIGVLWLCVHVHVVLLRCMTLRLRVFGGAF